MKPLKPIRSTIQHLATALVIFASLMAPFFSVSASTSPPDTQPDHSAVTVLESNRQALTLELSVPEISIEESLAEGQLCQRIALEGYGSTNIPGSPELPGLNLTFGIPVNSVPRIEIVEAQVEDLPGTYTVCPTSQPVIEKSLTSPGRYLGEQMLFDEQVYQSHGYLPASQVGDLSTGFIRSQRVAQMTISPIQFNPLTGSLRQTSRLVLSIDFGVDTSPVINTPDGISFSGTSS